MSGTTASAALRAGALPVPADLARRVTEESYARLLGYPDGRLPGGRVAALADRSRRWFARHAAPWSFARPLVLGRIAGARVPLADGPTFTSRRLAERLGEIAADRLVAAVVTAGSEVDVASARLWREDRPDEAYFLDRFGAAVAVHLGAWTGEHLRALAAAGGLGLAPGYSPGYDGWPLGDQVELAGCLTRSRAGDRDPLPGPLRVLDSGMIEPRSSLLAVFGVTADRAASERQWRRHKCSWCSLARCALRATGWRRPSPP